MTSTRIQSLATNGTSDSRVIARIEGFGLRPVPHSFNSRIIGGRIVPAPNPALGDWQVFVKANAVEAMGDREPYDGGNVWAEVILIARTPYGFLDGDIWGQEVRWDRTRKRAIREGPSVGDLDNTLKSTLDALRGIVFADDVQVRSLDGSRMIYGPEPGFRITVRRLESRQ